MVLVKIIRVAFLVVISLNLAIADEIDLNLFDLKRLNDNVYVVSQDYGHSNINFAFVIGEHDVALITSMMKDYSRHVQSLVQGITEKKIEYVFALDGDYYQYNGSRLFVENGATFVARENLIPDAFANRILVASKRIFDLKYEVIEATPTKAHTDDHMMLKLKKSNIIFAGDAVGFDWIVYSGKNGPLAHLDALKSILRDVDDETKIFPGNWSAKQYGNKVDLENLIGVYEEFVNQVFLLSKRNMKPEDIAADESIHSLLRHLNSYDFQKDYLVHYVKDVLSEK
ncbi:hypothetical protein tinsulaeT_06790 [Thalassotalea insulae]|uniref:MBL fold metallo-hydrolase n=1 Tax=Thalassotalea insulae TaxID=2056778 RepID=A0ABQ6GP41_9GAMM|nr:hypothetical protein [Thalassotalea insulae]GLX77339.1 hypothetical protein tinsulaeT_06790 [Thalassotalea insulae]